MALHFNCAVAMASNITWWESRVGKEHSHGSIAAFDCPEAHRGERRGCTEAVSMRSILLSPPPDAEGGEKWLLDNSELILPC